MRRRCRCICRCMSACNADLTRPDQTRPDPSFLLTKARKSIALNLLGTDRAQRARRTADSSLLLVERGKPRRPDQPLPRRHDTEETSA